jgi:hypothetical protein
MYGNSNLTFVKGLFFSMYNSNMAALRKFSLTLTAITNDPLELGMWHFVYR